MIVAPQAYPRAIDFEGMAHIAGLVAGGAHPSPVPHADVVTCTTTKTLRGPRGGIILARSDELTRKLNAAVFPGVQGSLHPNVLAAKAVCLGEALKPAFRDYARRVADNARRLAAALSERQLGIVARGTDTHMVLLDLSPLGILGSQAETALARAGITSNRNPIPFDRPRPAEWTGLRLGVAAVTTHGFGASEIDALGAVIADLIHGEARSDPEPAMARAKAMIAKLLSGAPA